jgi:hypothetical protein
VATTTPRTARIWRRRRNLGSMARHGTSDYPRPGPR